jgi:hypothetical protein
LNEADCVDPARLARVTNTDFLNAMCDNMNPEERVMLCSFGGDPGTADASVWVARPWNYGDTVSLPVQRNNYATISSFHVETDGKFYRRKDNFVRLYAIMIDDVGTKIPLSSIVRVPGFVPSSVLETSPGNMQVTYFLREWNLSHVQASELIKRLVEKLVPEGTDPGMMGVTRVLRLPVGSNGKEKYRQNGELWRTRLRYWRPERYSVSEVCDRYGIHGSEVVGRIWDYHDLATHTPPDDEVRRRSEVYDDVFKTMRYMGRVTRAGKRWTHITCPWVDEHTGRTNSGAALIAPERGNNWHGGFKCHHGHCQSRDINDVHDWLCDEVARAADRVRGPFIGGDPVTLRD